MAPWLSHLLLGAIVRSAGHLIFHSNSMLAFFPCSAPGSKLTSTAPARLLFALHPPRFKFPVMSCLMSNITAFPPSWSLKRSSRSH